MRNMIVAGGQLGPIQRDETKASAVKRMVSLMEQAATRGAQLIVFPELALTTFFPRWWVDNKTDFDHMFESAMPNKDVLPLFEVSKKLNIAFHLGYAELTQDGNRYNTAILVNNFGKIVGKYRKIHLPGHSDNQEWRPFQHLEKYYFEKGDLGFPVFDTLNAKIGICICNDRRWPETWRVLGLQGAELIVLGYNTPLHYPLAPEHDHLQYFHNELSVQAGCYQNGVWSIAVAKAGFEEGCELIGGSIIVAPTGEVIARSQGSEDQIIIAEISLDRCQEIRDNIFNFAEHRQPKEYSLLTKE